MISSEVTKQLKYVYVYECTLRERDYDCNSCPPSYRNISMEKDSEEAQVQLPREVEKKHQERHLKLHAGSILSPVGVETNFGKTQHWHSFPTEGRQTLVCNNVFAMRCVENNVPPHPCHFISLATDVLLLSLPLAPVQLNCWFKLMNDWIFFFKGRTIKHIVM